MTYQAIGAKFAELLKRDLTPQEFAAMRAANAIETNKAVCHSHDYLDANMTMLEAFDELGVRSPIDFDHGANDHLEACALWGAAWTYAFGEFLS